MILDVLLAVVAAGVLVFLIAWGVSGARCTELRELSEERPGACVGCGFEHNFRRDGCAVLRKISRIVAATGKRGTTS